MENQKRAKMYKRKSINSDFNEIRDHCREKFENKRQNKRDELIRRRRNSDATKLFLDVNSKYMNLPNSTQSQAKIDSMNNILDSIVASKSESEVVYNIDKLISHKEFLCNEAVNSNSYKNDAVVSLFSMTLYNYQSANTLFQLLSVISHISSYSKQFAEYIAHIGNNFTILNTLLLSNRMEVVKQAVIIIGNVSMNNHEYKTNLAISDTFDYVLLSMNRAEAQMEHIKRILWICYLILETISSTFVQIHVDSTHNDSKKSYYCFEFIQNDMNIPNQKLPHNNKCSIKKTTFEIVLNVLNFSINHGEQLAKPAMACLSLIINFPIISLNDLIKNGYIENTMKWLTKNVEHTEVEALHVIAEFVSRNVACVNLAIRFGLLNEMTKRLESTDFNIMESCLYIISNILSTTTIYNDCFIHLKLTNFIFNTPYEFLINFSELSSWTIYIFLLGSNDDQIKKIVSYDTIERIFFLLKSDDDETIICALKAISIYLNFARKNNLIDFVSIQIAKCEGLKTIEKLQNHPSKDVYFLVRVIIDQHCSARSTTRIHTRCKNLEKSYKNKPF